MFVGHHMKYINLVKCSFIIEEDFETTGRLLPINATRTHQLCKFNIYACPGHFVKFVIMVKAHHLLVITNVKGGVIFSDIQRWKRDFSTFSAVNILRNRSP